MNHTESGKARASRAAGGTATRCWLLCLFMAAMAILGTGSASAGNFLTVEQASSNATSEIVGSGDGRIHVIPSLHPCSIKNGEKLTITAMVKSQRPVTSVTADLGGAATVELQPNAELGGTSADQTVGMWSAEWVGAGLEEKVYPVVLTITDDAGHSYSDTSLVFSDPAAGNSRVGSPNIPDIRITPVNAVDSPKVDVAYGSAVIDTVHGYAYFGSASRYVDHTTIGTVTKVALGENADPPTRVGTVVLGTGESKLRSAVIDVAGGYAYFGTETVPGHVVKVALGEGDALPRRVAALTLNENEDQLYGAVMDPDGGYAYFGSAAGLVKVTLGAGANPPSRVGLCPTAGSLGWGVVDQKSHYAYFYDVDNSKVIKFSLGTGSALPVAIGSVDLGPGAPAQSAAIDADNGYLYVARSVYLLQSPDGGGVRIDKIGLGVGAANPYIASSLDLSQELRGDFVAALFDPIGRHVYFGGWVENGTVLKLATGEDNGAPAVVGITPTHEKDAYILCGVIDPASGHAYFGKSNIWNPFSVTLVRTPPIIMKVDLGGSGEPSELVGDADLNLGERYYGNGFVDQATGDAYFTGSDHFYKGVFAKFAVGDSNTPLTRIGALHLDSGFPSATLFDASTGYAYIVTEWTLLKYNVRNGGPLPELVATMPLPENFFFACGVLDSKTGTALIGHTSGGTILKIRLGEGSAPPTIVNTLNVPDHEFTTALLDADGYSYWGTDNELAAKFLKIAPGDHDDPPRLMGTLLLDSLDGYILAAAIDPQRGYAYLGTYHSESQRAQVIKIGLAGREIPEFVSKVVLPANEEFISAAALDVAAGQLYFATYTGMGTPNASTDLVRVAVGEGNAPLSWKGEVPAPFAEKGITGLLIDPEHSSLIGGSGYSTPNAEPTNVGTAVKYNYSNKGRLLANNIVIPEDASVDDVRFFSHAAVGNLRFSIYDNQEPKNLLWSSDVVPNLTEGTEITHPISGGSPATLNLPPGTYWLAWQTDSTQDCASYRFSLTEIGFYAPMRGFVTPPATLSTSQITPSKDLWTLYLTYNRGVETGWSFR